MVRREPIPRSPRRPGAGSRPADGRDGERGFALVAVLLVLAILGVVGAEFAYSMRLEATMVRSYRDVVLGQHLAEAGIQQAIREILTDSVLVGHPDDGPLTFFGNTRDPLPRLPREKVPLGGGRFTYRITDEDARIDVNLASADKVDRLLYGLGLDKRDRDVIVDSIQDWKDTNEEHRLNGAESEDTYLKLPIPYRSRNANFTDVRELLQVHGVAPALYYGADDRPGLRDLVTAHGGIQVNMNTAPELVLRAHGLSDAEVSYVIQTRRATPFAGVPGNLTQRGLGVVSRTFRIEAEGWIAGQRRARITAIVRKEVSSATGGIEAAVVGWMPHVDDVASATDAGGDE
jgi:type II secretory pathway component PulK